MKRTAWMTGAGTTALVIAGSLLWSPAAAGGWMDDLCKSVMTSTRVEHATVSAITTSEVTGEGVTITSRHVTAERLEKIKGPKTKTAQIEFDVPGGDGPGGRQVVGSPYPIAVGDEVLVLVPRRPRNPLEPSAEVWVRFIGPDGRMHGEELSQVPAGASHPSSGTPPPDTSAPPAPATPDGGLQTAQTIQLPGGGVLLSWTDVPPAKSRPPVSPDWEHVLSSARSCVGAP